MRYRGLYRCVGRVQPGPRRKTFGRAVFCAGAGHTVGGARRAAIDGAGADAIVLISIGRVNGAAHHVRDIHYGRR